MTSGRASFEFWLYRKTAESGLAAYLQGDPSQLEVGIRVDSRDGKLSYSTGTKNGTGLWTGTAYKLPVGEWQKISIVVDIDHQNYSARAGEVDLCEQVPFTAPRERFVESPA